MTDPSPLSEAVEAYIAFYEEMTPDTVTRLEDICAPDVRFRDPFNDVTGVAAYRSILERMFEDVDAPRFAVRDWALSGRIAYLRWDFSFQPRKGGAPWASEGMTELHFDESNRVIAHLDHWDSGSQFYARLPLIGSLIRLIRKRLSV